MRKRSLLVAIGLIAWTTGTAAATAFSNTTPITFPTGMLNGAATLYPSPIAVSGLSGSIVDVNVTLTGLSEAEPDDVDVLLVGPTGQNVVLMADDGGLVTVTSIALTFDDAATASLPDTTQIAAGTYKPTVGSTPVGSGSFDGGFPAPIGPHGTTLSVFNTTPPNGTWNLYVYDDTASAFDGSFSGGWTLDIRTNAPTITSFTPTTGAIGSQVVLTGTNFTGTTVVTFNGTPAATFTVDSATQITATVPVGVTSGPISVTTPAGVATSATSFVVAGPAISSFTPASGKVGTTVVVAGTNLTGATAVRFDGTPAATFTVDSATQITATVPAGASTGPITVTIPSGTSASGSPFVVRHGRNVALALSGKNAKGTVDVKDAFASCGADVPVKLQHFVNGKWKPVANTHTKGNGSYQVAGLTDSGKYRTVAKKTTLSSGDVCLKDISPVVKK